MVMESAFKFRGKITCELLSLAAAPRAHYLSGRAEVDEHQVEDEHAMPNNQ